MTTKTVIPVRESDLREWVRDLCRLYGWTFHFQWNSLHSPKGMLDLFLTNREQRRIMFVELKTETGKMTPNQQEMFDNLKACGQEVYLLRPSGIEWFAGILRERPADIGKTWMG